MVPESTLQAKEELIFTEDENELCSSYIQKIVDGKATLLQLLDEIKDLITDADEFKRCKGTNILCEVLVNLPESKLSSGEIDTLTDFLCCRISDHFVLSPVVLKGFLALSKMDNMSFESISKVFKSVNDNITCQAMSQSDRFKYYSFFEQASWKLSKDPGQIDGLYFKSLINAMDGESDPRNLKLIFSFIPLALRIFTLPDDLLEEMFAVLECYFPLDFSPVSSDISREDLKGGLENCLCSNSKFIPFCVPLVLEKLESNLKVAHMDSLDLIKRLSQEWGGNEIQLSQIWPLVKEKVITDSDSDEGESIIDTVCAVVAATSNPDQVTTYLDIITHGCGVFLSDPTTQAFTHSAKLYGSLALSSPLGASYIISQVVPKVLSILDFERLMQSQILNSLIPVLQASVKFDLWNEGTEEVKTVLGKVPTLLLKTASLCRLKSVSMKCLRELTPVLSPTIRQQVYSLLTEPSSDDSHSNESELVRALAELHPEEVKSSLLEKLSFPGSQSCSDGFKNVEKSLDLVCWCCHTVPLVSFCTDRLLQVLRSECLSSPIALQKLRELCESVDDTEIFQIMNNESKLTINLINIFFEKSKNGVVWTGGDISNIAHTTCCAIRALSADAQSHIVNDCQEHFFKDFFTPGSDEFKPLHQVIILEGIIGPLRPDTEVRNMICLVENLLNICFGIEIVPDLESSFRIISAIVNKISIDSLDLIMEKLSKKIEQNLNSNVAVLLTSWVCKGFIMRSHPNCTHWMNKIIDLLTDENLGMTAAEGFKIILCDTPGFLNRECHCKVGILFKQRVFENVPKLLRLRQTSSCEGIYLSLAYIFKHSPQQLIQNNLKESMEALVLCMSCNNDTAVQESLEVIASLMSLKPEVFEEHISTIVPRCINLSQNQKSMQVRINALRCIRLYCNCKELVLLPYKNQVINGLIPCLDDRKRLARREAVQARTKWFLIGSPS